MQKHFSLLRRTCLLLILVLSLTLIFAACGRNASGPNNANRTSANGNNSNRSSDELIDINSASKTQLIGLPGIGEAHAQKIIDGRPYHEKTDLVRRNIISQSVYDQITDRIIARQR